MKYLKQFIFFIFLLILFFHSFSQETHKLVLPDTTYTITDPDWELILAASTGDTNKVLALLEIDANVNYATLYEGITPLMYAAQNGYIRTVEILIDSGANVNAMPNNGISALLGACIAGHVYVVDTLILNGAKINTQNYDGITPLMYASAFDDSVMVGMLLFYKAKVNLKDDDGNTALHYSVFYNNLAITEKLINFGASIDQPDNEGFTPILIAAQNGYPDQLDWLISSGADINTRTNDSLSALSLAIINKQYETVNYLCDHGSNINASISNQLNELSLARLYGDREMVNLMEAKGAEKNNKLWFNKMILGFVMNGNVDDFMLGFHLSLLEAKYGLVFQTGYITRPGVRSVLYEHDSETYYQFWEKRSCMNLGLQKQFILSRKLQNENTGAFVGLKACYTYGNFRGSNRKPDDQVIPVPQAGFFYNYKQLNMALNYEYMKIKNTNISGHRINFTIGVNINLSKTKIRLKQEPDL